MSGALRGGLVLVGLVLGCSDGSDGSDDVIVTRESAELLGTIVREPATDELDRAREALAQDAWRREHRFLDATAPGHLFASTRVRQLEIDHGLWTSDELFQVGGQLFTLPFTIRDGWGGADSAGPRRVHLGRRGGPDASSCTSCHWRGGLAGAGGAADNALLRGDGVHESSGLARNPPALIGAGVRERLAEELSAELIAQRDEALEFAAEAGYAVRISLVAKGLEFGAITVEPDGDVVTDELRGVDPDLRVKPFGWKGTVASVRVASEDALQLHHGLQSEHLVAEGEPERLGPHGGDDPDGDGVTAEITEGQLTALSLFVALLELPIERPPSDDALLTSWARGRADFDAFGCAECHTPSLVLDDPTFVLEHRDGGPALAVDLSREAAPPRLEPDAQTGAWVVRLYSDLRRHSMGPALAEDRDEAGVGADEWLTPPLWGLARSRPYLHDGRAATIEEAILLHAGEAQAARDAFAERSEPDRAPLRVFLTSLGRAPRLVAP